MNAAKHVSFILSVAFPFVSGFFICAPVAAQKDQKAAPSGPPRLSRTIPRHGSFRFAYGGTVSIAGAPVGSITIEGWQRNEVKVNAEIELHAGSAEDLDRLAAVNNLAVDQDANHLRILTTGTHDKSFMKRVGKNFPKSLIGLPWKIDYQIKVPTLTDLEIDSGKGPIKLAGVEGALRLNALESEAELSLTGGNVSVIVQQGTVKVSIPTRGWHGLGAQIRLASGNLNIELMPGFSADIDADVLRLGEVKSTYSNLEPREGSSITPRSIRVRAGNGGATLSFTVGDGTIQITQVGGSQ